MIIPKHVQIEPINGACTSACNMCTVWDLNRASNIMKLDIFEHILNKFLPYRDQMQFLSMTGMGESLLDKDLVKKIKIAKKKGFKGIGFSTNGTELNEEKARALIGAGLDTIICSIDGIKAETHEAIRIGTKFNVIVNNVEQFIRIRNETREKTRVIVRFVRQKTNVHEWPDFLDHWSKKIDKELGDEVVKFDVANWGGRLEAYNTIDINQGLDLMVNFVCEDVFDRMWIFSNGEVSLCCGDDSGFYKMGNVIDSDPIEIYNNKIFNRYREMMLKGRFLELKHCKDCTIARSRELRNIRSQ